MGLLVAGTKYRGEFEERLKKLMEEIKQNDDIILVKAAPTFSMAYVSCLAYLLPLLQSRSYSTSCYRWQSLQVAAGS